MSVTTEIRKTVEDARGVLSDPKPLHALAGAGDLLVEQLRAAVVAAETQIDAVNEAIDAFDPAEVSSWISGAFAARANEVPAKMLADASRAMVTVSETYDALAMRGASLLDRVQGQKATQDLSARVATTVSTAKATRTTAVNAAKATLDNAKLTRESAEQAAKSTLSRAKATRTMARGAAEAAVEAVVDAAAKTGAPTKPVAKKPAATKPAAKKAPAKKAAAKKPVAKKPVAKKAPASKTSATKRTSASARTR